MSLALALLALGGAFAGAGPREEMERLCRDRDYGRLMPQCPPALPELATEAEPDPLWLEKALGRYCAALGGNYFNGDTCLWGGFGARGGPS